jgi:hypothetical protein
MSPDGDRASADAWFMMGPDIESIADVRTLESFNSSSSPRAMIIITTDDHRRDLFWVFAADVFLRIMVLQGRTVHRYGIRLTPLFPVMTAFVTG